MQRQSGAVDIKALLHPADLQEWMDALPYADLQRSAHLIETALKQTNAQGLKPAARLELLRRYFKGNLELLGTYIKGKGAGGLRPVETKQQQIEAVKRVAAELAAGYRLAVREALATRTLFQHGKPTAEGLLYALKAHAHMLLLHFHQYASIPKTLWKDVHEIYGLAERQGDAGKTLDDPDRSPTAPTSIGGAYQQILATAVSDPYRLPFGAVWEIYEQLADWIADTHLYKYKPVATASGFFVVDLSGTEAPVNYSRFRSSATTENYRVLDFRALQRAARQRLDTLDRARPVGELVCFSPHHARFLLEHLVKAWGLPPQRSLPRQLRQGAVTLTCGIHAVYYHLNGDQEFPYAGHTIGPLGIEVHGPAHEMAASPVAQPEKEDWNFFNESAGGYSIYTLSRSRLRVRIGELIGMRSAQAETSGAWAIGIIRWLIMSADQRYRVGVQLLATEVRSAAVRPLDADVQPQRAVLMKGIAEGSPPAIVTVKGIYRPDRALEVEEDGRLWRARAGHLLESTTAFDCFAYAR